MKMLYFNNLRVFQSQSRYPLLRNTRGSRPFASFRRQTQLAVFSGIDESQDFRNRGICTRQMPHLVQTLGKDAEAVKQLLIKRSYHRETLTRKLPAFHADVVEATQTSITPAPKPTLNHVTAPPA